MDYTTHLQSFYAGTLSDRGESWYKGCNENQRLVTTTDLTIPVPNANFLYYGKRRSFKLSQVNNPNNSQRM
jgi:hypothetical protein